MTLLTKILLGAFLVMLALLGLEQYKTTSLERQLAAAKLAPMQAAVDTAQRRVDTIRVQLAGRIDTVRRTLAKVRVDTFMVAPQSAQDTATAVAQLPTLVAAHDRLQRQCTALGQTCDQFRVAAAANDQAKDVFIAGLQEALTAQRPSRLGAIWNRVKLPLAFGGGLYLGLRAKP